MQGVLIADDNLDSRKLLADLFIEAGYNVMVTNSAATVLHGILKKTAQVVLLSSQFDEVAATELVPLLKQCNRDLTIILVSDDISLPLMRRLRREGIFYHALTPQQPADGEELRQAVACAFDTQQRHKHSPKEETMKAKSYLLSVPVLCLLLASEAWAVNTNQVYTSGWLVLAFLGFCALLVTVQLIPAMLTLWGMIKGALSSSSKETVAEQAKS